jgi:hypothetical protein
VKASIGTAVEILKSRYPAMFADVPLPPPPRSQRQPPELARGASRHEQVRDESASELKDWLESQNEALGELVLNGDVKISKEAWRKKAVKNSFFLGLETRWLNSKLHYCRLR